MAKQQNTYAKRVREVEKKRKAEDKLARRKSRGERDVETHPDDPAAAAPDASQRK